MKMKLILTVAASLCLTLCFARQPLPGKVVIDVASYGVKPNMHLNVEPVIRKLLRQHKADTLVLNFAPGRYDIWPHNNEEDLFAATRAFDLSGMKNVTIDGRGAEFVFHGRVMPFYLYQSENVTLKNFSIDWDRPFISQGRIQACADNYVDLSIDKHTYPYEIRNDSIYFIGEGWKSKITKNYNNLYHKDTKEIVYQTRDNPLGGIFDAKVTALNDTLVRFHFKPLIKPEKGTYIALYHGAYITDGIGVMDSRNTVVENVNIYHTLSCGVIGYKSTDIFLKDVNIVVNDAKGRVFSTVADATHFNGCKGRIVVDGMTLSGAGDDFLNVHGMYAKVEKVVDKHTVIVSPNGRYIGFAAGEEVWRVDSVTMQRHNLLINTTQQPVVNNGTVTGYSVSFENDISGIIKPGDLLENKSRNPDLTVKNCNILKRNRARGMLVTTAGKVVVENNYFRTAGAAILIDGDTDLWFESGAVKDVTIRNNVFEDCYTSGNNILEAPWGWGEGVITITPSVKPKGSKFPAFHNNIRIENNLFKHYDYAVLYARSVGNLQFTNNKLELTHTFKPFYRKVNFFLDGCRKVNLLGNQFSNDFPGKNIYIMNMKASDVAQTANNFRLNIKSKLP